MIQVRNMTFFRGSRQMLKPATFELAANQFIAVIGANGAGKSSLLGCLSGENTLADGEVVFDGLALPFWPQQQKARRFAVLPQKSALMFDFIVTEVVAMGRLPHRESRIKSQQIVNDVLDALNLKPLAQRRYLQLSGGEQQRVQIARVMAQVWSPLPSAASFMLLDEPTASLDLDNQQRCLAAIQAWVRRANTAVVAIHDINLAAQFADKIMVLRGGELLAFGDTNDILTAAVIQQAFDVEVQVIKHPTAQRPVVIF